MALKIALMTGCVLAFPPVLAAEPVRIGVTTILSLGVNRDLVYTLRDEQRAGHLGGATIFTAGRGIGTPNGVPDKTSQIKRPR